jgi:hypothetical protein
MRHYYYCFGQASVTWAAEGGSLITGCYGNTNKKISLSGFVVADNSCHTVDVDDTSEFG